MVYSIDEVFMDVTDYLNTYKLSAHDLAMKIILDVLETTGIMCRYMLSNNDVDLVILDIMLPDGDGISLCREIKAKLTKLQNSFRRI